MSVKIKKSAALNKLNLTPMIDVVFQLLLFFLVASRFEEEERAYDMPLPKSSQAMSRLAKPKEIFVNVDSAGRVILGGRVISKADLLAQLRQAAADNPGRQTVIIRGDKQVALQHVIDVRDVCARANIRDCQIATAAAATGG
ncbi:MAG: biopolymer transporter ExbD [Planctomycetaceae bacterium]|nr:biopolymer transporter ExbD [Planctomycetaceae bacterium]